MAKGTSGYLKPKKKVYEELDEAMNVDGAPKPANPVDAANKQLETEVEESHGITNRIRNIFAD